MPNCLMLDDTLDVLPWARQTLHIEPVPPTASDHVSPQVPNKKNGRGKKENKEVKKKEEEEEERMKERKKKETGLK